MDWMMWARFGFGVVALIGGAEALVRGATRLAAAAGVSRLVIGLTVVAVGTGSPEMAVAIRSALAGQSDIAVGNVVGANILNILFILGASAVVAPLVVSQGLVRRDVPILIGASVALWLFSLDMRLDRWEGVLLVAGMVAYTVWAMRQGRREGVCSEEGYPGGLCDGAGAGNHWALQVGLVVGGILLLGVGAGFVVDTAIEFARVLGVSELVISLTVVAMGTTLPEAATSVIAATRGQADITVGNVIGSNLFNILGVLGVAALLAPGGLAIPVPEARFDILLMIVAAVACVPVFVIGGRIERSEGGLFLCFYGAFMVYLYLRAVGHAALEFYSGVMAYGAIPLTLVILTVLAIRQVRTTAGSRESDGGTTAPSERDETR